MRLDEDLFHRALAHAAAYMMSNENDDSNGDGGGGGGGEDLVERLRRHDAEALYEVASSMNSHGTDRISSVLIWHALADDGSEGGGGDDDRDHESRYVGHVPSAMALGFSYYDVDKPRSLRYFLMATSAEGRPHQAGMYNAGRLFLELGDACSALAYIRGCATLENTHPAYAAPMLGMTCRKAYHELSVRLTSGGYDAMGLEEAVECFGYANIDDFPKPDTTEFRSFHGAMRDLEEYAKIVRRSGREDDDDDDYDGGGEFRKLHVANVGDAKGLRHLTFALEKLMDFQLRNRDDMSGLQSFLVGFISERIRNLIDRLEMEGIRKDEL